MRTGAEWIVALNRSAAESAESTVARRSVVIILIGLLLSTTGSASELVWPPPRPMDWICPPETTDCVHPAEDPSSGIQWRENYSAAAAECSETGKPVLVVFSTRAKGIAGDPFF